MIRNSQACNEYCTGSRVVASFIAVVRSRKGNRSRVKKSQFWHKSDFCRLARWSALSWTSVFWAYERGPGSDDLDGEEGGYNCSLHSAFTKSASNSTRKQKASCRGLVILWIFWILPEVTPLASVSGVGAELLRVVNDILWNLCDASEWIFRILPREVDYSTILAVSDLPLMYMRFLWE